MVRYVKNIRGPMLWDKTHIVLTREQYEEIALYEDGYPFPTGLTVGRCFRRGVKATPRRPGRDGLLYFVEPDPEPGYVLQVGRVPLFLD